MNVMKLEAPQSLAPLSTDETSIAYSGPAIACNRMLISMNAAGVRIAFCEQFNSEVKAEFRTAVIMPFTDAIAFKNLLSALLSDVEKQLATIAAPESAKANG